MLRHPPNPIAHQQVTHKSPSGKYEYSPRARGQEPKEKMADFVQSSQSKNAVRELATPIASVTAFNLIVQSVITDNPFGCVSYMTAGETHDPVEKTREGYTGLCIVYDRRGNPRPG